ncbi:glycosyltransferase family 2 protein [Dongia sp.]|uniref:glycosyltransferase family 2 protein n=1 Tax=Dongia sp. TaxID=1977262 RepID=UPI0035B14CCC
MSDILPNGVSVIIPARNRERVLARAIESVLAQTAKPSEIVVIDDGSTDRTIDIACGFEGRSDVPVSVIKNLASVGAPEARNIGARAGRGRYLAFLDSDDAWAPNKLERQLAVISAEPGVAAVFSGVAYHRGGRVRNRIIGQGTIAQDALMRHNVIGPTSSCLVLADAFHAVGGFRKDMPSCQDWELWLRLSTVGTLRMLPEPLLHYYYDGSGQISSNAGKVMAGHRIVFDTVYRMLGENRSKIKALRAEHEMLLAKLNAMTFYDARATFGHLREALAFSAAPRLLARACHYGLRVTYHKVRLALAPAGRR